MKSRMNDEYLCFVCGRMACGLAVGTPKKLAWYCNECTPQIVREAMMSNLNEIIIWKCDGKHIFVSSLI